MKPSISRMTRVLVLLACISVPAFGQRTAPCLSDSTLTGYETIQDMNLDMMDILNNITDGGQEPEDGYFFQLCPQTTFDASGEPLIPMLNNSEFFCGETGTAADQCIFDGGRVQVLMMGDLTDVLLRGLTFQGFNETSVAAFASTESNAAFEFCVWTSFQSMFVIEMSFQMGADDAQTITVVNCDIRDAIGGSLISNDGGNFLGTNITLFNVDAVGAVVTGNLGTCVVYGLTVAASALSVVGFVTMEGFMSIARADIIDNVDLGDCFFVTDNSVLNVEDMKIRDNLIERAEGQPGFNGIYANTSTIDVVGLEMSGNTNVQYGVASVQGSTATVTGSQFISNTGRFTSAPLFARLGSSISISTTNLEGNENFLFSIFVVFESDALIEATCIIGGSDVVATAFIGQDSTKTVSTETNFITDHASDGCTEPGLRLFQEDEGADCFINGTNCTGECEPMALATECVNGESTSSPAATPSPSPAPTPSINMPAMPSETMPSETMPVAPSETMPVTPSMMMPAMPSETMPAMPSETMPVMPSETMPVTPSMMMPVTPSEMMPATPNMMMPATPNMEMPATPNMLPVEMPNVMPIEVPNMMPVEVPTIMPTARPTMMPTARPTMMPVEMPTMMPVAIPVDLPGAQEPAPMPPAPVTAGPTRAPGEWEPSQKPVPRPTYYHPMPRPYGKGKGGKSKKSKKDSKLKSYKHYKSGKHGKYGKHDKGGYYYGYGDNYDYGNYYGHGPPKPQYKPPKPQHKPPGYYGHQPSKSKQEQGYQSQHQYAYSQQNQKQSSGYQSQHQHTYSQQRNQGNPKVVRHQGRASTRQRPH